MSAQSIQSPNKPFGVSDIKLGMWVFLASEIMFFAGLIGSYIVLRLANAETWPNPSEILGTTVLAINTFVLICSSLTMVMALEAAKKGNQAALKKNLTLTMAGGIFFLTVKLADYTHLVHGGFTISSNLFGSFYYMLTGFHGLHVFAGVVALAVMRVKAGRGQFSPTNYDAIESTGLYWHFVDLVWIFLFAILCLV